MGNVNVRTPDLVFEFDLNRGSGNGHGRLCPDDINSTHTSSLKGTQFELKLIRAKVFFKYFFYKKKNIA